MRAVYKREVQSYFSSIVGYIVIALLVFFMALFFSIYNLNVGYSSISAMMQMMILFLVLSVPILTMRTFAEERRQKTDQILLTSPVSITGIVLGKYFSVMTILAIPFAVCCAFPIVISFFGTASLLKDYCTIFAMLCMTSLFVSIGIFISSLTDNQIVAVFVTICVLFVMYLFDALVALIPETSLVSVIGFFVLIVLIAIVLRVATRNNGLVTLVSIGCLLILGLFAGLNWDGLAGSFNRFLDNFAIVPVIQNFTTYSTFDLRGIIYFISFTALFLFLTVHSIQKRRWN